MLQQTEHALHRSSVLLPSAFSVWRAQFKRPELELRNGCFGLDLKSCQIHWQQKLEGLQLELYLAHPEVQSLVSPDACLLKGSLCWRPYFWETLGGSSGCPRSHQRACPYQARLVEYLLAIKTLWQQVVL